MGCVSRGVRTWERASHPHSTTCGRNARVHYAHHQTGSSAKLPHAAHALPALGPSRVWRFCLPRSVSRSFSAARMHLILSGAHTADCGMEINAKRGWGYRRVRCRWRAPLPLGSLPAFTSRCSPLRACLHALEQAAPLPANMCTSIDTHHAARTHAFPTPPHHPHCAFTFLTGWCRWFVVTPAGPTSAATRLLQPPITTPGLTHLPRTVCLWTTCLHGSHTQLTLPLHCLTMPPPLTPLPTPRPLPVGSHPPHAPVVPATRPPHYPHQAGCAWAQFPARAHLPLQLDGRWLRTTRCTARAGIRGSVAPPTRVCAGIAHTAHTHLAHPHLYLPPLPYCGFSPSAIKVQIACASKRDRLFIFSSPAACEGRWWRSLPESPKKSVAHRCRDVGL